MSKIKRKYGNIPAVIEALYRNQVAWDFIIASNLTKKESDRLIDFCEKKRKLLAKELASWFK